MGEKNRTERTYYYELWRAGSAGVLETAGTTFLLLIAVRFYEAGPMAKALVAAGGSFGLMLSPLVVSLVTYGGWPVAKAASRILAGGAGAFLLAAALPDLAMFILCSVTGMAASAAVIPLLTQMYQENYPEWERGRRFSRTIMIRIGVAALFSKVAGDALTGHIGRFPVLLIVFGMALGFSSLCLNRCPTRAIISEGSAHPWRALRFLRNDRLFRRTLLCWMLMGFANLMMLPLRVEYLANPNYQQSLSVAEIAFLTGVIPNLARLILSPVWGYLFDHANFFALRIALNVGFALGILAFFFSPTKSGLIVGAIVYGISNAGGDVAWSLWVTKFAPAERVADYMSIHTFLTGLRGVLAPMVAFYCARQLSLTTLAVFSSGLIAVATLLLIPELKFGRRTRRASAVIEEISD